NPFAPDRKDRYEFYKRLVRLQGKPMVIQVRRAGDTADAPPVNIEVPASYHSTFGMRMRMGQITAVREGSPAAVQGVVWRDAEHDRGGGIITQAEVTERDGSRTEFARAGGTAASEAQRS